MTDGRFGVPTGTPKIRLQASCDVLPERPREESTMKTEENCQKSRCFELSWSTPEGARVWSKRLTEEEIAAVEALVKQMRAGT